MHIQFSQPFIDCCSVGDVMNFQWLKGVKEALTSSVQYYATHNMKLQHRNMSIFVPTCLKQMYPHMVEM